MTTRAAARHAVRSQYFFVANDEEAFSVAWIKGLHMTTRTA